MTKSSINNRISFWLFLVSCLCCGTIAQAQVVVYLEVMKEAKPIKYYAGQMISFRASDYPKDWMDVQIDRILDEEQIILYDGGMVNVADILEVRRGRPWAKLVGASLQTFGLAWLVFGGLAHFGTSNFDFGVDTAMIGGGAFLSGLLISKAFKYKKYKIGRRHRIKILDLSWPEPRG